MNPNYLTFADRYISAVLRYIEPEYLAMDAIDEFEDFEPGDYYLEDAALETGARRFRHVRES